MFVNKIREPLLSERVLGTIRDLDIFTSNFILGVGYTKYSSFYNTFKLKGILHLHQLTLLLQI